MAKRNLNSILREIQKKSVKDPGVIRQYMQALGNRTLYSLMYGEKEHCSAAKRYECWSCLEFVLLAYEDLADLTEEEIERCMKRITLKDFLCLADHLNDRPRRSAEPCGVGAVRDDKESVYTRELALVCLLRLMLRARVMGDEDVNNFYAIHVYSMLEGMDSEEDQRDITDTFYILYRRLDPDRVSWMTLDAEEKQTALACLRKLLVESMEKTAFPENFSMPETIERCRELASFAGQGG